MVTLETPPTPTYGPDTFTDLAEVSRILKDNDDALAAAIGGGGGGGGGSPTNANIVFQSGYSSGYTGYVTARVSKLNGLARLQSGPIVCPQSFSAAVYYHWATLPSGFEPSDGLNRMGNGLMYTTAAMVPVQVRVQGNGNLQFLSPVAVSDVSYFIPGSGLVWDV